MQVPAVAESARSSFQASVAAPLVRVVPASTVIGNALSSGRVELAGNVAALAAGQALRVRHRTDRRDVACMQAMDEGTQRERTEVVGVEGAAEARVVADRADHRITGAAAAVQRELLVAGFALGLVDQLFPRRAAREGKRAVWIGLRAIRQSPPALQHDHQAPCRALPSSKPDGSTDASV